MGFQYAFPSVIYLKHFKSNYRKETFWNTLLIKK